MLFKRYFSVFKDKENNFYAFKKDENCEEIKLAVVRPTQKIETKSQIIFNKKFKELSESGAMLRPELERIIRERNLWNDDKQQEFEKLTKLILDDEMKLSKGGIKKSEGRKIALEMIKNRAKLLDLQNDKNILDQNTAESQAENEKFNYQTACCTIYADKEDVHFFENYEDYLEKSGMVGIMAAKNLMELLYNTIEIRKQLPEFKFLLKYGFCNDKLQLINEEKQLIDEDGRLINEYGRFINSKGEFIDKDGNLLNQDGTLLVESADFLD